MSRERLYIVNPTNPLEEKREFLITGEIPVTFRGSRIFFATSLEDTQVVIKIPKDGQSAEREWDGLTKTSAVGISVPKPILVGLNDLGQSCIVSERIYGELLFLNHGYEARMQLGQTIRQIHTRVAIEGVEWLKSGRSDYAYYDEKIKLWGGKQELIGDNSPFTQHLFQALSLSMIDYCSKTLPVFNHNDIHDGQVIRSNEGRCVLIDFGSWIEDRPMNDLGFYLFHCLRNDTKFGMFKGFMRGYFERDSLNEADKQALIFNLLFISTRAVVIFSTFRPEYVETARENHQKVLKFIEGETLWKEL